MTAPYRKKLIEVALPLKAINEASAREKSIRHGHPSTLHLWWARRPLAACRAVLFASLVDDPDSDPVYRKADGTVDEDRAGLKRAELFNLIEELVKWENSNNSRVINAARAEIARCVASRKIELGELAKDTIIFGPKKGEKHPKGAASGEGVTAWDVLTMKAKPEVVNAFLAEQAPPVLDPFCGGGSIPLEAQRLGLRAYGSDLNPVPVLITKALIEIPPKFAGKPPINPEWQAKSESEKAATVWQGAQGLAEDVRYYGKWMRDEAEKRIGHLYPKVRVTKEMAKDRPDLQPYVGQELTVIAWLWARTVRCANPACSASAPLIRSFVVSSKPDKRAWLQPSVDTSRLPPSVAFDVRTGNGEPPAAIKTGKGAKFKCIACGESIREADIRACFQRKQDSVAPLVAVVQAGRDRRFVPVDATQLQAVAQATPPWTLDEEMNSNTPNLLSGRGYGVTHWRELFTQRQMTALVTLSDLVPKVFEQLSGVVDADYAKAITLYLGLCASKAVVFSNKNARWRAKETKTAPAFGRHALPMVWDFAEVNPFGGAGGDFQGIVDGAAKAIEALPAGAPSMVAQVDATKAVLVETAAISTDPPYYDNIAYADLSDFFYIWLRRTLRDIEPQLLSTVMTPKRQELVASAERFDGDADAAKRFFESGLGAAFKNVCDHSTPECPITVYYAFKQTEDDDADGEDDHDQLHAASTGWETMLEALIAANLSVFGTWPSRTEGVSRLIAMGTNALASSIVLVCRPRAADAALATRKDFINALRHELPEALKNLQHGNIAPVDLAQSAIGPGMAVFTRYAKVIESDGSPMTVRTALGIINQVLDEVLAEQEGDFDADTRWALAWFEQHGTAEGPFGVAETLSKAKNTAVNALVEAGIVKSKAGKVRLLRRDELPDGWDPATDTRLRHWEVVQHLIHTLETKGEAEAAKLLNRLGGMGETARELAYRLYSICERKKWAEEALAYNSLVIAWPELSRLALSARVRQPQTQSDLFS